MVVLQWPVVTISRKAGATGVPGNVDIPGIREWCIAGWCVIVGIDDGQGKVGTATMIAPAVTPVDKTMQLERIQKDHRHARRLGLRRAALAKAFA